MSPKKSELEGEETQSETPATKPDQKADAEMAALVEEQARQAVELADLRGDVKNVGDAVNTLAASLNSEVQAAASSALDRLRKFLEREI
jgi:hypothetical protein